MSGYEEDTSWKIVAPRRKGTQRTRKVRVGDKLTKSVGSSISCTKEEYETVIFDKIIHEKNCMLTTPFWKKIVQILGSIERLVVTKSIVAYGIGSFETKNVPKLVQRDPELALGSS